MTRLRQRLENLPEHRADQFRVAPVREPANPEEFARFVANVNTQFDAIAQRFAELVPRTLDPTDYVRQDELASLMESQFNTNDQYLTSAGAEDLGTQSSEGKTSQGRNAIDEAVQALVDGLVAPGVVFAGTSESGAVTLVTDATNFYWDDTNDILHANVGNIIGAGAEATPSLYLAGDSDTGIWHPTDDTLAVSTAATERLRFLPSYAIAINRTTTGIEDKGLFVERMVEAIGDGAEANFRTVGYGASSNFMIYRAGGSESSPTALTSGNEIGQFRFVGLSVASPITWQRAAQLIASATENWTSSACGTSLTIRITPIGTAAATPPEIARIVPENTELLPIIALMGDADTGLWHPAADTLALSCGEAEVMRWATGAVTVNEDGDDVDFRVETAAAANAIFAEGSSDRIGINQATLTARLHVTESATDAAIPVLQLDQADVDEPFIKFIGTAAAATLTNSLVAVADVSTATVVGYVKIEIQDDGDQITDGDYYVAAYSLA